MNETMLNDIFHEYMAMKRHAVAEADVDNDVPMLLYLGKGPMDSDTPVVCVVIPSGDRYDLCQALAYSMAHQFIPHWAAVLTDGYVTNVTDVPRDLPGGLARLFVAGHPDVKECLTITACSHDGDAYGNSVTYWYDDDDDIWFRDDDGPSREMDGPLIDVIQDVTSLWGKTQDEIIAEILKRSPGMN